MTFRQTLLAGALLAALLPGAAQAQYPHPHFGSGTVIDGLSANVQSTSAPTSRPIALRFADTINVKDYGAVGDGVTDDTAAFNAAIAAAVTPQSAVWNFVLNLLGRATSNSGAKIYAPCGKYILTSKLVRIPMMSDRHSNRCRTLIPIQGGRGFQ